MPRIVGRAERTVFHILSISCARRTLLLLMFLPCLAQAADCVGTDTSGPEMVLLPAGTLQMGSPDSDAGADDDEKPQHPVTVASFAMAVCEVSKGEFARFVDATSYKTTAESTGEGCHHNSAVGEGDWEYRPEFTWRTALYDDQSDEHPVVCVSHHDVVAYIKWFNGISDGKYRLPTEAEWEYAARASTVTPRYYADRSQCDYANGADETSKQSYNWSEWVKCEDDYVHTAPVGSFAPNDWGLRDMLGNVWEWTADCWHSDYKDAPATSVAWLEQNSGDCSRRVLRGGAWDSIPQNLRSAYRFRITAGFRNYTVGFRLAMTP